MDTNEKEWLIYGAGSFSHLIASLLIKSGAHLTSFIVDDEYLVTADAQLPVYGLSELKGLFPPATCKLIIGLGYTDINGRRCDRFELLKNLGYRLGNVISPYACILSDNPFLENIIIFEHAIIQPYVKLGTNIIIRSGANIGHHSVIGDHSFIASGVVTGGNVTIGERCFIGVGAVIRDNVKIADRTFIGAGAVVVKDTETDGVYIGNPARKIKKTAMEVTDG